MDAMSQLPGMPTAIRQQVPRRPTNSADAWKVPKHCDGCRRSVGVVDNLEVGPGGESKANGQLRKWINPIGWLCKRVVRGVGFHNDPCRLGAANSPSADD